MKHIHYSYSLVKGMGETKGSWMSLWTEEPVYLQRTLFKVHNYLTFKRGFPGGSYGKESTCSAGDLGLIPGLGRSPGEGNDNPLQYSCLRNAMGRGAWGATVHGVSKSWTQLRDSLSLTFKWQKSPKLKFGNTAFVDVGNSFKTVLTVLVSDFFSH